MLQPTHTSHATRCTKITPMEHSFKVSERVLVEVIGFEPWPATIENVVFGEDAINASYHVRLDGSSKSIPVSPGQIQPLKKVDEKKWSSLCLDERWHGARKRNEVVERVHSSSTSTNIELVEGDDEPSSLWNFVSIGSDYEDVADVDVENLKLSRLAHNAKVRYTELEQKFRYIELQNKWLLGKKLNTDDYEYIVKKTHRKSVSGVRSNSPIRFRCPVCLKEFKTRMALKKHLECNEFCGEATNRPLSKSAEQPQQCPKCFSLYKNEEMLLKHMATHDKHLPKKKNGIRDYLRQVMSNNRAYRSAAYTPANGKPRPHNSIGKSIMKIDQKMSSPEESEQEEESEGNSTSDTDSLRTASSKAIKRTANGTRNNEAHSEREKERRLQMRHAFDHLADVLGVNRAGNPKNSLLHLAIDEIQNLVEAHKKYEQSLADLRDMNIRLVSREYQLRAK